MQNPSYQQTSSANKNTNTQPNVHHIKQNNPENNQVKFIHNVEVKGILTGLKPKTIEIHPQSNKLIVYDNIDDKSKGKSKQFQLHKVTFSHQKRQDKGKKDCLHIDTNDGKKYSLRGSNSGAIAEQIQKSQTAYKINKSQTQQQPINMIPKQINYMTSYGMNQFQKILIPQTQTFFNQNLPVITTQSSQPSQDFSKYPRKPFYFNPQDWEINPLKGTIIFINKQKKKNQKKVIGWIIKKFITSRSFMGISFPTFVMKPQTILESYAKAIGAAPFLFDNVINPVERMKKFICLIQSFSLVFCDLSKPFNPPLGETFQAKIGNGNYYAEQICHHPPISAFMYEGKRYVLSGSMELTASIGPNSASGLFVGDLKLQFDDGMIFIGRLPVGQFSGFMLGNQKFESSGSFYAYNNKKLVCSISSTQKCNFFTGYIGKLKPKNEQQFLGQVGLEKRFEKFPFYERQSFEIVYSSLEMSYNSRTIFDGKEYFNASDKKYLPLIPQSIGNEKMMLKSDSRLRKDVALRSELKFEESQVEKEKIEDEERYFRKLRGKSETKHHK